jgi:L-threonylcarbamoyladenylate synthase
MKLLSSSDDDISLAAIALANGALVAFPTETVYGLGGDAFNVSALARIFEAKKRPFFDPLIIHIAETTALDRLVLWEALDKKAKAKFDLLTKHFWPGPLTLILPKQPLLPDLATSGLPSVAIRFPDCPIAQKLITLSTGAVAAPSANPFGCLSPVRAEHVAEQLGDKVDFIIDGGKTSMGLESTVLDISTEPCRLLRPGTTSREIIEAIIGPVVFENTTETAAQSAPQSPRQTNAALLSPGQLKNHYAPQTPLSLHKRGELASIPLLPDEGRLYYSFMSNKADEKNSIADNVFERIKVLSAQGNPIEAAANFFDMLHELDKLGLSLIRAEEAPPDGLGAAINDRLRRAASCC